MVISAFTEEKKLWQRKAKQTFGKPCIRGFEKKVHGTAERPRLAIFRSLNHIYVQVINDDLGKTLVAASTTEKELRSSTGGNIESAEKVGEAVGTRALAAGIENVVFDRGGYVYHGRVKALTNAARRAGLNKSESSAGAEVEGTQE